MDDSYSSNLNRLFGAQRVSVPNTNVKEARSFPDLKMVYYGETIVSNVDDICADLNRKPSHFIRYLKTRAGCSALNTESKVILQKYITQNEMKSIYQEYIKIYVICRECSSRHTLLDDLNKFKCEACGASYMV